MAKKDSWHTSTCKRARRVKWVRISISIGPAARVSIITHPLKTNKSLPAEAERALPNFSIVRKHSCFGKRPSRKKGDTGAGMSGEARRLTSHGQGVITWAPFQRDVTTVERLVLRFATFLKIQAICAPVNYFVLNFTYILHLVNQKLLLLGSLLFNCMWMFPREKHQDLQVKRKINLKVNSCCHVIWVKMSGNSTYFY